MSHLQQVLARRSALPVVIPQEADEYRAGICYIGEPDAHLSLAERSRAYLIPGAHNRYRNRTVDLLFKSVAAHAGRSSIDVVLRGRSATARRDLPGSISPAALQWCLAPGMGRRPACLETRRSTTSRSTSPARLMRLSTRSSAGLASRNRSSSSWWHHSEMTRRTDRFKQGVLAVTLPKRTEAHKPAKKIDIKPPLTRMGGLLEPREDAGDFWLATRSGYPDPTDLRPHRLTFRSEQRNRYCATVSGSLRHERILTSMWSSP
jgi:hypothetical protein